MHGSCLRILPCAACGTDLPDRSPGRFVKTMSKDARATYTAKSFDLLRGLEGISDAQITEHLSLYAGYVKQVNSLVPGARRDARRAHSAARLRVRRNGPPRALLLQLEAGRRSPALGAPGRGACARRDLRIS